MSADREGSGLAGQLVRTAGDRAGSVADWLEQREPGDILDEVKQFARRRPGVFIAAAAIAGVAAGRLTKGLMEAHSQESGDDVPASSTPIADATSSARPAGAPAATVPPAASPPPVASPPPAAPASPHITPPPVNQPPATGTSGPGQYGATP